VGDHAGGYVHRAGGGSWWTFVLAASAGGLRTKPRWADGSENTLACTKFDLAGGRTFFLDENPIVL
jgi:hypothetical protein